MGIHKRSDGSFYAKCDFEGCMHVIELKAKDFWEASAEAKRLGFRARKDKYGHWVNYCTRYCEMCDTQEPIVVKVSRRS
jgi:hypothetical protein